MRYTSLLTAVVIVACTSAKPVDMLRERAATSVASSSTYNPVYPYTASMCAVTPISSPAAAFHCNQNGRLNKPSVLVDGLRTGSYTGCADICQQAQPCISFGFDSETQSCTLYKLPLPDMGFVVDKTSTVEYANRHCFSCSGTTTLAFTVVSTTTITTTTTAKTTTTKKGKTSKTTATPTTTYTAGPVNLVDGGDFAGPGLGGFQVSLTSASGSFSPNGNHYAYCCTSQLLGLDAACMLTQNLNTTIGAQYDVAFYYKFVNKVTGLSTITAPFQGGVIQEVLGSSSNYQRYAARYFSLTDPSLFSILMNVPLGGNAVCLTNITVTPF